MSKSILVFGATGRQGGAVMRALQGGYYQLLVVTRDASTPAAQKLLQTYPKIQLVEGSYDEPQALFTKALALNKAPIWGVFSVLSGGQGEEEQGKGIVDAAIQNKVKFFVYSSVDRGGANSSNDPTSVPHWGTKHNIEKHLAQQTNGTEMNYVVLRPVAFMEGISDNFAGKALVAMWQATLKKRPLQLIATRDIGWFAAQAFQFPDEFAGRYISLAGAELTLDQANEIFRKSFGRNMPSAGHIMGHLLGYAAKDYATMFKWINDVGNAADVDECRRLHPGIKDFGTWLATESDFSKKRE